MLPLKELTHPAAGPLNMAVHLPDSTRLPDLGPKSYIAYGRYEQALFLDCMPSVLTHGCMKSVTLLYTASGILV